MFCPKCGEQVDESDTFCRSCGFAVSGVKPAGGEPPLRPGAPGPAEDTGKPIRRSGEATASLVLGLFSFIPVAALLAVIFGHLARASIRRSGGRLLGDGMAVFGLALGYLSLGVWLIIGLWALVKPELPSTRRASDQRFAVMLLRSINAAAATYASMYDQGYPPSLAALGPPKAGAKESAQAAGFLTEMETSGQYFGYRFTFVAGERDSTGRRAAYNVHADPLAPGERTHYFTDESGVITSEEGKEANAQSPPYMEPENGEPAAGPRGRPKAKPQWEFGEHLSPMDGTKTQILRMEAGDSELPGYASGTLMIRCSGGKTDLYVITGKPAEVEYGTDANTVRIRVDDRKPVTQHWTESDDHEALFAPSPIGLAQEIARAHTMLFEYTPFQDTRKLIRFDLEGLKNHVERLAIPCRWSERQEAEEKGEAAIISWPQGAQVSIDGEGIPGITPLTVRLQGGRHRVEIVKPGYQVSEQQIAIKGGGTTQVEVTLLKTKE